MGEKLKQNKKVVFGIFETRTNLENAIVELRGCGFDRKDISALLPTSGNTLDLAVEKSTKAPEGTATGALTGAVVGGAFGWLVSIGALAIPGFGPFIVAGPILGALAGVGFGGTLGGIAGALIGMGIPEYEAKRFEHHLKEGGLLLSVHTNTKTLLEKAKQVLVDAGAKDVTSTTEVGVEVVEGPRYSGTSLDEVKYNEDNLNSLP